MGTEFLTIEGTVLKGCAYKAIGKIVIPEGVTEIGVGTFFALQVVREGLSAQTF